MTSPTSACTATPTSRPWSLPNPDLIISGQRFSKYDAQIKELAPDVPLINLEPREGQPFDQELIREVTDLGEIFGKQDEAKKLVDDFNASIERAKKAYDGSSTVMAVDVSGGNIGYVAPGKGRTWGPVFDLLSLKPALEVEGSTDSHTGRRHLRRGHRAGQPRLDPRARPRRRDHQGRL